MTDIQVNKLSMFQALKIILGNFAAVYENFADFKAYVTLFLANIDDILNLSALQERDNKGVALNKDSVAASLSEIAKKVRSAALAHAVFTKDLKLRETIDFPDSDLNNVSGKILGDRAKIIYDTALPLKTHLTRLNITEADITALNTIRLQYLGVIAEPRVAIVETKTVTASIARKFRETDNLLRNEIDPTIRIFEYTNFDFFEQYKNGRIIVDLGRRKSGNRTAIISGTIRHFETLALLPGALVRILETGQSATTGADGAFSFTFSQSGVYTLQVELAGYRTYTEDGISIQAGNQLNLDIELESLV
jgi:hypothetical protein